MNVSIKPFQAVFSRVRRVPGGTLRGGSLVFGGGSLVLTALLGAGVAQAHSAAPAPAPVAPGYESLTSHGITLYGIVDLGLQYESHGAPISDYFPAGSADIVQKNSNGSIFGVTPNNLSQSRIGLTGKEPLVDDWSAVFRLETFFNPQSGEISDALKSLVQNNGRALAVQTTNLDSSVAGQLFQQSYVGFSSPTMGTLTFGRQNTLLADGIAKYDPQGASQAFSLIGLSGTTAGGGDTEDRRLDSSLKYIESFDGLHAGAMFKFNGSSGGANTTLQFQLGAEVAGLSVDAYWMKVKDAIAVSALSAAQVTGLPALGFAPNNSLSGTISDNTTYNLSGLYNFGVVSIYGGYEHIDFANPATPLTAGFDDIGGYKLAYVNNAAFPNDKILQVYWAGVKYHVNVSLELTAAYYGYKQNAYGTGANAGCETIQSGTCSGNLNAFSFSADYRISPRFDTYAGFLYTGVKNGLANGYLNTNNINPTAGVRYRF